MPKTIAANATANKDQSDAKRGRGRPAGVVAGKKIKKDDRMENFKMYLFRILKKAEPDESGISKDAMTMMNSILLQVYRKITYNVTQLRMGDTMTGKDIQSAVKLCIPGELGKHAMQEATTALMKYQMKAKD